MTQRFNTLDGLRGVAAIAVMIFHFTQHTSLRIFSGASLAVDLFFCLSGFVIAYSYQERLANGMSVGDFFVKRLLRLYPMFLCGLSLGAIALVVKVAVGETSLSYHDATMAIFLNALYVPYLGDFQVQIGKDTIDSSIFPSNDPGWSLFFELLVNLLFALVASRRFRKNPLPWVLFSGVGLIAYVIWTHMTTPGWSSTNLLGGVPRTLFSFFAGVYIYFIFDRVKKYAPQIKPSYIVASTLLVLLLPTRLAEPLWLPIVLVLVPTVVILGTVSETRVGWMHRLFDYLGWLSYPLYCIHYPVYSIFSSITGNTDSRLWGALLCAMVSLILAHVAGKFIDEPLRASLSRRLSPSRVAA